MKNLLQILSGISTGLSVGSLWTGETDRATLFLVWALYLKYLSNERN